MPDSIDFTEFGRIPEQAIGAFERVHGLNVTVHDLIGLAQLHLDPAHTHHRHPFCEAVKSGDTGRRCMAWEVTELRPMLASIPQGRAQVCHAGALEWMTPVFVEGETAMVLFAGPRAAASSLVDVTIDRRRSRARSSPAPPFRSVGPEESEAVLESLRQLGARLGAWIVEMRHRLGNVRHAGIDSARRDVLIRCFVRDHHTQPVTQHDLARLLQVSPSRCAHVVRETTGRTLRQLLYDARVQTACWLLSQTDLPLKEVIHRVGVNDLSYFHRLFRTRTGITPARYRRQRRT